MATIGQLRKKAREIGVDGTAIRKAKTADELQALIMDAVMNGTSGGSTTQVSQTTRPARKQKTAARKPVRRSSAKSAVKSKPAAQSATTGKAKRTTSDDEDRGRNELVGIDFKKTAGWNAREGSAPDVIIQALRHFKGDRAQVFAELKKDIWDYVGKKMRDGSKRTMASAEEMLRYRISRTAWDFAMKTGQHQASTNRKEYEFTNGKTASKPTKAAAKPQKARRGPGRPKGSRNIPKATTAATEAPKRRGRPPKKATATAATTRPAKKQPVFAVKKKNKARA
jgi:hypothetical protein